MADLPAIYIMPLPPEDGKFAHECYMTFMHHMNRAAGPGLDQRILSAISYTAKATDNSTAHISQLLVEMGLRAPKAAFPGDFISHITERLGRDAWMLGAPTANQMDLARIWQKTPEAKPQLKQSSAARKRPRPLHSAAV